ncbi:hypothetical protein AAL_05483 [Moelleriella libera RCEF 2490]|uniref:Uncharacterized protein n=1 Tax=Moelleriella libera RCEF 2490 TaxID=1081109 RepID=A0A168ACS7_9HYPO|nr:hypothetical protein AAL_05483 [Moelleriella libera RCEF 2490]
MYGFPCARCSRHGKFRPSLMKLVSSNAPETVWSATSAAAAASNSSSGASSACSSSNKDTLGILTQLRGVGPATASLLLSVLDPQGAIFFSDEAYWWLCCGGRRDAIRYTPKEYDALCARARALGDRLRGVAMVDVEKAAYVAMREGLGAGAEAAGEEGGEKAKSKAKGGRTEGGKDDKATKKRRARTELGSPQRQQGKTSLEKADADGKAASDAADAGDEVKQQLDDSGLRRSKRTRAR